jgi:hypothetical protein
MNKVAIMTDTASNLPQEMVKKLNIKLIPFHVMMDGKDSLDTEIEMEDLYAQVSKKENIPTMTPFPVEECLQAFQDLSQGSEAKELKRKLLSQFQRNEIHLTQDSLFPVIHSGPSAIKLSQYSDE